MLQLNDYSALMESLVADMVPTVALHHVLHFLEQRVPFDTALVLFQDRAEHYFKVLVEYRNNSVSQRNTIFRTRIDRAPIGRDIFGEDYQDVFISGGVSGHTLASSDMAKMGYREDSVAGMLLHVDKADNVLLLVAFLSSKPNAFNDQHQALLNDMRAILTQVTHPFFLSHAEALVLLRPDGETPSTSPDFLRCCPDLAPMMQMLDVVARTDCTLMIHGPTGSGKGLVAESAHVLSGRCRAPFVQVNCAAIPDSLLESELFGFEKGAFTGAQTTHKGYFEQANHGTLFLDEVGELSPQAQAKLLHVLEKREVVRVGGERRIPVDVRLVAATHRDLQGMAASGEFREDLLYRLRVFPLRLPSLAERKADIPILAEYFYHASIARLEGFVPHLTRESVRQLAKLPWPGNVRQLSHVMERAVLMALVRGDDVLRFDDAIIDGMVYPSGAAATGGKAGTGGGPNPTLQARDIQAALEASHWRIQGAGGAAELLGVHPATLRSRMKILHIPLPRQKRHHAGTA